MKRFTQLFLFLTCLFFLPVQEGRGHHALLPSVANATVSVTHAPAQCTQPPADHIKPWKEYFKRRPVGLNDGHEEGLAVYSCHIRPQFVYVHTRYHSYAQTFINVAVDLSDWRGPPVA